MTQETLPFVAGSQTSAEAATSMKGCAHTQRERMYAYFLSIFPMAASDEDVTTGLVMSPSSVRPRRGELAKRGLIEQVGEGVTASGRRCVTWRAVV